MSDPDLAALLTSWELELRAERKSVETLRSYSEGVRQYIAWSIDEKSPKLSRSSVTAWIAHLLDSGAAPATAGARQLAVRRFSAWLAGEGEIELDQLLGLRAPKLDQQVVQPLSDDQLKALLRACSGSDLRDRRDESICRLMLETGARAGEVAALGLADIDLIGGTAIIRRGKESKAEAQAAGRWAEVRIGELLGEPEQTYPGKNALNAFNALTPEERVWFRKMARHVGTLARLPRPGLWLRRPV